MSSTNVSPLSAGDASSTDGETYEVIPNRIFVGGFPSSTVATDLRDLFLQFGDVTEVNIKRKVEQGTTKGYAFVNFSTDEEACLARSHGQMMTIGGRPLKLGPAMRRRHFPAVSKDDHRRHNRNQGYSTQNNVHRNAAYSQSPPVFIYDQTNNTRKPPKKSKGGKGRHTGTQRQQEWIVNNTPTVGAEQGTDAQL